MANMRNIGFSLLAAAALALPASAKTKAKAEVTCSDGTTSKAGQGACSHHGGVADVKAAAKPEKSAKSKARADTNSAANDEKSAESKARAEASTKGPGKAEEKKPEKKSSGGILGGLFGRRNDTAQGKSSTTSPRSSTRETKSGQPTARCKDGTTSYSAHHSGSCSGHGGVAEWLDK